MMSNTIQISEKARKEKAKQIQIEEAYKQRAEQLLKEQWYETNTIRSWLEGWSSGWLKAHGLNLYSYPSPFVKYKREFLHSNEPFFVETRKRIREAHKEYIKRVRNEKSKKRR
jgi:hypothetical protein